MKLKKNLKPLLQAIIQGYNHLKVKSGDNYGLIFTIALLALFFLSGILGILDYFIIKVLLFLALASYFVYCILIMIKNKNHPEGPGDL